ncbi:MAG: peptide/nickel transport system substrate-binding protein [Actinomycetota bacterium]|jgi:ABC-type transport system substrate-binding protein|nr:peptide/nickel transport system substrate-binding protein [Actinomycetota bacterium]
MPRRHVGLLALVPVLALVAATCSRGNVPSPTGQPTSSLSPGVLRVGIERPQSLDPAQARSPSELLVAEQLFDGLTAYDAATSAVVPAVAASWTATPDQTHWQFTLRPDAKFANGRALTSVDVKYTLERIARKGSSSPAAAQLDAVSGFKAFNLEGKSEELAGVTTPAPNIVSIALDQSQAALPAILGNPAFGIVPREAVEAPTPSFAEEPVGSGSFMVQGRAEDVIHLTPAPGVNVPLRGVDLAIFGDDTASYDAFLAGRLDWTAVPSDRVEQVAEHHGRAAFRPYLGQLFYAFNLKSPKFADVRFREAVVRAIDRDAIVRAIYGAAAQRLDGVVPDGVPGFQPGACGDRCGYDLAKAKALVADVFGGQAVPEVAIDFDDTGTQTAVAEAMQANLTAAGIPVVLRSHPFADYLKFAVSGQQEIFRLGWIGPYPTPDAFLTPLFRTGVADNVTGFSAGPVDDLLGAARAEGDEARRTATYQQAEKLVMEQLPVIPLAQFEFHSLVSGRVTGLVMSGLGTFDATRVQVGG